MTTINEEAFNSCFRLENIIVPKHCNYNNSIYDKKWNHLDKNIDEEGPEWLKHRFNYLPLHQLCYEIEITIDSLKDIAVDDPLHKSVDKMNMTPLHVLCCNPNTTLEIIQTLASKCTAAAFIRSKNGTFPVFLYLELQNIVQVY